MAGWDYLARRGMARKRLPLITLETDLRVQQSIEEHANFCALFDLSYVLDYSAPTAQLPIHDAPIAK